MSTTATQPGVFVQFQGGAFFFTDLDKAAAAADRWIGGTLGHQRINPTTVRVNGPAGTAHITAA